MKTKNLFMLAFASAMILTMPSQVRAEASEERSEVSRVKTLPYPPCHRARPCGGYGV